MTEPCIIDSDMCACCHKQEQHFAEEGKCDLCECEKYVEVRRRQFGDGADDRPLTEECVDNEKMVAGLAGEKIIGIVLGGKNDVQWSFHDQMYVCTDTGKIVKITAQMIGNMPGLVLTHEEELPFGIELPGQDVTDPDDLPE